MTYETKGATAALRADETKALTVPFDIKADSLDDEARSFTGLAATWDLDLGGDVIHKGAFRRTLSHWKKSKKPLPLLDSHDSYGSVRAVIGKLEEANESDAGLETKFSVIDGPDGDEIWRRIKGGYVDGLSIGYRPIKSEAATEAEQLEGVWRHLKEIELREVSVVLWPMNPGARVDTGSMKALMADVAALKKTASERPLTTEEKEELVTLQNDIGALLKLEGTPAADPPLDEPKGLAPEDPKRIELDARMRDLKARRLATRIKHDVTRHSRDTSTT
jgi:HK97 family phage prohead protease